MIPIVAGAVIGYFIGGKKLAILGAAAGAGWNYAATGRLAGLSEDFDSEGMLDETQYGAFYPSGGGGLPNLMQPQQTGGIPQYDGATDYNSWYQNVYAPWIRAQSLNAQAAQAAQPQMRCRRYRNGRIVCVPVRAVRGQRPMPNIFVRPAPEEDIPYYNN
jgi:hypothetical protein